MNRHERRAAEARTRNEFKDYNSAYRRAFKRVTDREIGEGFMRSEAVKADGVTGMILHPNGTAPPPAAQCDVTIGAAYGAQRFEARARTADINALETSWPSFVEQIRALPNTPVTGDARSDARQFIFEMLMGNYPHSDGTLAALTASAIVWLARTLAVGLAVGETHKAIHYEITDTGPGTRNYRLMLLGQSATDLLH